MGGRGSNGARNTPETLTEQIESFSKELESRQYGVSKKLVPEKQQKEYRQAKRNIAKAQEDFEGTVVLAGGFRTDDEYLHTTAKLNSYQRIVRNEVKNLGIDVSIGAITLEQAEKELKVLKSLDATIQERRKLL